MGHAEISSDAFSTLHWRKWNKSQVLPLAEDITKLQMYLKDQLKICTEQLSISATKKNYDQLRKIIIVMIVLFNRRRAREVQYLEVLSHLNRDKSPCHEDVFRSLLDIEKKIDSFIRFR